MFFSSKKNIIDSDQEDWLIENYQWLVEHIGFPNAPVALITPTIKHFPDMPPDGHDRALYIFAKVKEYMGMTNWRCELIAQEQDVNVFVNDGVALVNTPATPLGTFRASAETPETVEITYNPKSLKNTAVLIATLAHELSHYLLACCAVERPHSLDVSDENAAIEEELLTDLLAITSGFGVFAANSRFNFQQFGDAFSAGWQSSTNGYLTEAEILFSLVLFLRTNKVEDELALKFLKPTLGKNFKKVAKYTKHRLPAIHALY